jgi:Fe-S cluster assembly protein SufD
LTTRTLTSPKPVSDRPQPSFDRQAFEQLLGALDLPDWLADLRREAWIAFSQLPLPSREQEEWMRTDIRLFRLDRFAIPFASAAEPGCVEPLLTKDVPLAGRMETVDGHVVRLELDPACSQQGILFGDLATLVRRHPDLLKPHFERRAVDPGQDKFSAMSAAFWTGGQLLYVPPGVCVEQPLHAVSAIGPGGTDLNRTLVVLGEGSEATFLSETQSTNANGEGLHCGTAELLLGPQARLRFVNLQNWGSRVWHFAHQKAILAREASLQWTIGALGSRLAKVNQHVVLDGQASTAQVNGVMFTEGTQHLSYHTLQHHSAPAARSDLHYKAALQDKSRTVWRGMIRVDSQAQKTDGYQRNDNLMLSSAARADSIPGLEIEADDVRCTHGSTSGRVDDEQVFYCRSRGLTRNEAVRMIVAGFFQQVFDRITIESVRDALGEAIGRRIRQYD